MVHWFIEQMGPLNPTDTFEPFVDQDEIIEIAETDNEDVIGISYQHQNLLIILSTYVHTLVSLGNDEIVDQRWKLAQEIGLKNGPMGPFNPTDSFEPFVDQDEMIEIGETDNEDGKGNLSSN